jgi:hypothetical protein
MHAMRCACCEQAASNLHDHIHNEEHISPIDQGSSEKGHPGKRGKSASIHTYLSSAVSKYEF